MEISSNIHAISNIPAILNDSDINLIAWLTDTSHTAAWMGHFQESLAIVCLYQG